MPSVKNQLPRKKKGNNKKWTKKKIIAVSILGVAALSFVVFTLVVIVMNLGPVRPIKSTKEEARKVGECGGYSVKYEELHYITLLHKNDLDADIGEYSELDEAAREKYERELESRVFRDIENNYVILSLCDEYGIKTDSIQLDRAVQDDIELLVENDHGGDFEKYKEWLAENNMTDSFLRLIYKVEHLETELLNYIIENKIGIDYDTENLDAFVDYVMEGKDWVRTIHAFYPAESDVIDTSVSHERAIAAFKRLSGITNDEERYNEMKSVISHAPFVVGYSITGNGIYFTHGQMGETYESAAFALDIYEASDVIDTGEGYYVIMRMPLEREHIDYSKAVELLGYYQYAVLKSYEDAQREKISFVPDKDFFEGSKLVEME